MKTFNFQDPIDEKFSEVEKLFHKYKLMRRTDSSLILSELYIIILQYDRYLTSLWSLQNLDIVDVS